MLLTSFSQVVGEVYHKNRNNEPSIYHLQSMFLLKIRPTLTKSLCSQHLKSKLTNTKSSLNGHAYSSLNAIHPTIPTYDPPPSLSSSAFPIITLSCTFKSFQNNTSPINSPLNG